MIDHYWFVFLFNASRKVNAEIIEAVEFSLATKNISQADRAGKSC
jgi:hypothetical protein